MQKIIKNTDFWVGSAACLIGLICLIATRQIYLAQSLIGVLGPRALPGFLSIGLLCFGAILIFRAVSAGNKGETFDMGDVKLFLTVAAIMLAYMVLLEFLGYIVATVLFLGVLFRFLGAQRYRMLSIVAITTSIVLYVGFHIGLRVSLPKGLLSFF